jgi:hypothetical protein
MRPRIGYMPRVGLDPSRTYNRPAIAPMFVGVGGNIGGGLSNTNRQFEYTLRQMAVSPFSVNSKAYMQRIRDEYGYANDGTYEALGTVGGIIGAGTGYLLGSGFNIKRALGNATAQQKPWYNPKRIRASEAFRNYETVREIKKYNAIIDTISDNTKSIKTLQDLRKTHVDKLAEAQDAFKVYNHRGRPINSTVDARNVIKADIVKATDAIKDIDKQIDSAKSVIKVASSQADDAGFALAKNYGVAVKHGAKVGTKLAGLVPVAGMAFDIASLGISTAGLVQSVKEADVLNTVLNSIAMVGDATAVVGDVLEMGYALSWTGFGAAVGVTGTLISTVGGLVSAGVSAIQGFLVGQTVGRSFSPEGAKMQQLFAQNLYAGMVQRPITSVATALSMVGLPLVIGGISRFKLGPVSGIAGWMNNSALGNQVRAGVSMMTLQAITPYTSKLDEHTPWAPDNPEDVSFVTAISLVGDINDNLYGATRYKSVLLGLASGDSGAMTKAMAESWGYNDGLYKSVTFDDIREALNLNLSPIGNSIFSVVGEMIIDPQNWYEAGVKMQTDKTVEAFTASIIRTLDIEHGRVKMLGGIAEPGSIGKLVEDTGLFARGRRLSDADRTRLVKDITISYLNKGHKGVRDVLMKQGITYFKGVDGTVRKVTFSPDSLKIQQDAILKLLDGMADGTFKYSIKNPQELARVNVNYKRMVNLKRKINRGEDISADNKKFLDDMIVAYENLRTIHGKDLNDAQLLKQFIEQNELVLSPQVLNQMYTKTSEMRYHMDLSDNAMRVISGISNPLMKAAQGASFGIQKWNAYTSRFKMHNKQKAVKIINKQELIDNLDTVVKEAEVEALRMNKNPELESFTDFINRDRLDDSATVNDFSKEAIRRTEEINQKREQEKTATESLKTDIEAQEKKLAELHKGNIYNNGRNYVNRRTKNMVYIDDNNVKALEDEVTDYGKDPLTGKKLNHDELVAKINKDKRSKDASVRAQALDINDKYEALLDYTYLKTDLKLMSEIFARYRTVLTLHDLGSAELNEHLIKALNAHNIFRRYTTAFKEVPVTEILEEALLNEEAIKKSIQVQVDKTVKELNKAQASKAKGKNEKIKKLQDDLKSLRGKLGNSTKRIKDTTTALNDSRAKDTAALAVGGKVNTARRAVYLGKGYEEIFSNANIDQTISMLDKMLPYFGLALTGEDENGNKITINMRTYHDKYLAKNTPLQLEYAPTPEAGVLAIIKKVLNITDLDMLTKGVLNFSLDFKDTWVKLGDRYDKKYKLLRKFISDIEFDITPEQKLMLLDPKNIRLLLAEIDYTFTYGMNKKYLQLQSISDEELYDIIFKQLTELKTSHLSMVMNKIKEELEVINLSINKAFESDEYKDMPFWAAIFKKQLSYYNEVLEGNTTYKFLRASLYKHTADNALKTGLFIERESMNDLLPDFLTDELVKKIVDGKGFYSLEDLILEHSNNVIIKQAKEATQKDWDYIKASSKPLDEQTDEELIGNAIINNLVIVPDYQKQKSTEVKKRISIRKTAQEKKQQHTDKMKQALDKLGLVGLLTDDMYSVLNIRSSLNTNAFFKLPYVSKIMKDLKISLTGMNAGERSLIKAKFLDVVIKGSLRTMGMGQIIYDFKPTEYLDSSTKNNTKKTYYELVKSNRRTTPGHEQQLLTIAKQLVYLSNKYDHLTIGTKNLVDLKRKARESDEDFLARRIVETYKQTSKEHFVRVYSDTKKNADFRSTKAFENAVKQATHIWMINNTADSRVYGFNIVNDDSFAVTDVMSFSKTLAEEQSIDAITIKNEIFETALGIFNQSLSTHSYDTMHNTIKRFGDTLSKYEQTDIAALGERNYITPYDVAKKKLFSDPEFINVIKDLVQMDSDAGSETYSSGIVSFLSKIGTYMNEDYANKQNLSLSKFVRLDINKQDDTILFVMKGAKDTDPETSINVFNLLFTYHLTYSDFITLLDYVVSKSTDTLDQTINNRIKALGEFEQLVKEGGPLFSYLKTDVRKLGLDKFEHETLDFDYGIMYKNMRFKDVLTTDIAESQDPKHPRSKNYKYTEKYYNNIVEKLYKRALKKVETGGDLATVFLEEILKTPANVATFPEAIKKNLIRRVFFMNYRIGKGYASESNIDKIDKKIESDETRLTTLTVGSREYTRLANTISINKTKRTQMIHIKNNFKYGELEVRTKKNTLDADATFENFYRLISNNRALALKIFHNTIDTDAEDLTIVNVKDPTDKKAKDQYTLVRRKNADGTNNYETIRVGKNVPGTGLGDELNRIIGEDIIGDNKDSLLKSVKAAAKSSIEWNGSLGDAEIVAASSKGILVVLPAKTTAKQAYTLYTKRYILRSFLEDPTLPDVFIITSGEYDTLKDMIADSDYKETNYAKKDPQGNVIGEELNIINSTANRQRREFDPQVNLIEAYLSDLGMLIKYGQDNNKDLNTVVKELTHFMEKVETVPEIKQIYFDSNNFNETKIYRDMVKGAKTHAAFARFLELVDPTGDYTDFNIELLGSIFFKNDYIKQGEDGTYYDLNKLEDDLKKNSFKLYNQMSQEIKINGRFLFTRIKAALLKMQKEFGADDTAMDYKQILSKDFIDNITEVTNTSNSILRRLESHHRKVYDKLMPEMRKALRSEIIRHTTYEEMSERDKYLKNIATGLFDANGKYLDVLKNPYGASVNYNDPENDQRKAVGKLKNTFNGFTDEGFYLEALYASELRNMRKRHQERVSLINEKRKNKKINNVNLTNLHKIMKEAKSLEDVMKTDQIINLKYFKNEDGGALLKLSQKIYDNITKARTDLANNKYTPEEAAVIKDTLDAFDARGKARGYLLDSPEKIHSYLVYNAALHYTVNVEAAILPSMDPVVKAMNAVNKLAEQGQTLSTDNMTQAVKDYEKEAHKLFLQADKRAKIEYRNKVKHPDEEDFIPLSEALLNTFKAFLSEDERIELVKGVENVLGQVEDTIFHTAYKKDKVETTTAKKPKSTDFNTIEELLDKGVPAEERDVFEAFKLIIIDHDKEAGLKLIEPQILAGKKLNTDSVPHFFDMAYEILNRNKSKRTGKDQLFKDSYEVYTLMSTGLLDDNPEFLTWIKQYFFKTDKLVYENVPKHVKEYLAMFGIKEKQQYTLFFADDYSIREKMRVLAQTLSKQEMFALTSVLNMQEKMFLNNKYQGKWSWKQAHNDYIREPLRQAMDTVEGIQTTGVFNRRSVWENSIIENVNRGSNNIKHTLKEIETNNKKLASIYLPYDSAVKEEHDMHASYLTTRENNTLNKARNYTRELYSGVFNETDGYSLSAEQKIAYLQAVGDVVIDSIAEEFAIKLSDIGNTSTTYQDLRTKFTDILLILKQDSKSEEFIKMREIGYAFGMLKNDRDAVYMWKNEFNKYMIRIVDVTQKEALDKAVQEVVNYFTKYSYLVNGVTSETVKAVMGRILYDKGLIKQSTVDRSAKEIHERATAHLGLKKEKALATLDSIAYELNPGRDINDISVVIYNMSYNDMDNEINRMNQELSTQPDMSQEKQTELNKLIKDLTKKQKVLKHVLALHKAINHKVTATMYKRVIDTWDFAYLSQKPKLFKETTAGVLYANMYSKQNSLKAELKSIERSNSGYLGVHGTQEEAQIKYDNLKQTELQELDSRLNKLNSELEDLNTKDLSFRNEAVLDIIKNNPELLESYILNELSKYETKQEELKKLKTERNDGIRQEVIAVYDKRKVALAEIAAFFQSKEYKQWRAITPEETAAYTTEELTAYEKTTETVERYRKEQKDLRKEPVITDSTNKPLPWKNSFKILSKRDTHIENLEARVLDIDVDRIKDLDDIEDDVKLDIVRKFFASILKEYKKDTSFKAFFKNKGKISGLTHNAKKNLTGVMTSLIEKNTDRLDKAIQKAHTTHLDLFKLYDPTHKNFNLDLVLNVLKNKIDSLTTDTKAISPYKKTYTDLLKLNERLKESQTLLTTVEHTKATSYENLILDAAVKYFNKKETDIDDQGLIEIAEYLSGSRNEITTITREDIKKEIDEVKKDRDKVNSKLASLESYLFENDKRAQEIKDELESLGRESKLVKAQHDTAFNKNYNYHKNGLSNIGVFKTLYNVDSDEDALQTVLDLSLKDFDQTTKDTLEKIIKDAGDGTTDGKELHNPVVDVLITRLNYLKQYGKLVKDTFVVFDMETAKDVVGNDVPYQMTLLKQVNGKFTIVNTYFNSPVFYDKLSDGSIGPTLELFYEQQQILLSKTFKKDISNIDDLNWINARTDALVKKIQQKPNDIAFVELFVRELTADNDVPIVAHNGAEFDLPNFDIFLKNVSKRLLTNLYYQEIKNQDPAAIRERLGSTSLGVLLDRGLGDEVIEGYQKEIKKIHDKIDSGELITAMEIDRLDQFEEAMWTAEVLQVIKDVERDKGLIFDSELKEMLLTGNDSEAMKLKQQIYKYIKTKNTREKHQIKVNIIQYFVDGFSIDHKTDSTKEITDFVETLLKETIVRYNELRQAEEAYGVLDNPDDSQLSRSVRIMHRVREARKTTQRVEDSAYERNTTTTKALIDSHVDMIEEIKGIVEWARNNSTDLTGTLQRLQNDITQNNIDKKALAAEIKLAKESLARLDIKKEDAIQELTRSVTRIYDTTKNPKYLAYTTLSKRLPAVLKAQAEIFQNSRSGALLRLEIVEQQRNMNELYEPLKKLLALTADTLQLGDPKAVKEKLSSIIISDDWIKKMLAVTDEESRTKLKAEMQTRINKLASYNIVMADGKTFGIDNIITGILKSTKVRAQREVKTQYNALKALWNSNETKKLFGKNMFDIDFEKAIDPNEVYSYNAYENLLKVLAQNLGKRNEEHFVDLRDAIVGVQKYVKDVDLSNADNVKDISNKFINEDFRELITRTINYDMSVLESHVQMLNRLDIAGNTPQDQLEKTTTVMLNAYLHAVHNVKDIEGVLENRTLFSVLNGTRKPINEMSESDQIIEARTVEEPTFMRALHAKDETNKVITRVYKDALRYDDKYAWTLKNYDNTEDVFYITENVLDKGSIITVNVYDKHNDTVQKFSFNSDSSKYVKFDLTYTYKEIGKEFITKKKKISLNTRYDKIEDFKANFYTREGATKGLDPRNVYTENGIDHSFSAIMKLVELYTKYRNTEKHSMKVADIKKAGTLDTELNVSKLDYENMTTYLEKKFQEEMLLLQWAKRGASFKDINRIQVGIANKILSKFKSQTPGKVLNFIPDDYSVGFVVKYDADKDAEVLEANQIDLLNSSEGSAGSSFMRRNLYTTAPLFKHTTNTIRTVLSNTKQYVKYTANKVINDLYVKQDAVYTDNLTEFIANDVYKIKNKKLFLQYDEKGHVIETFTPNVVTEDSFNKYKNDVLHRVGINMTIGFFNDGRAIEDTILMDADDAVTFGWNNSDKTWLSAYGFKGAVRFVPGLRKTYGVSILASADSVYDRRAFGAVHEMSLNNLRKYLLEQEHQTIDEIKGKTKSDVTFTKELKQVIEDKKAEIKKLFPIKEGKMIIDPNVDYGKLLEELFNTDTTHWTDLHRTKVDDASPILEKMSDGTEVTYTVDPDAMMYRGEVYVILDSEHIASHMETKTEVSSLGGINTVLRDTKNSVRGGIVISPSVVYTMMAKGDVNWEAAFPADNSKLETYMRVHKFGIEELIDIYKLDENGNERSPRELFNAVDNRLSSTLSSYILQYYNLQKLLKDPASHAFAKLQLERLDIRVKQKALDNLSGTQGAYYKSMFRKHEGVRQQVVANSSLNIGEIRSSREAFKTMLEITETWNEDNVKGSWLSLDDVNDQAWTHITSLKPGQNTITLSKAKAVEYIDRLNSFGIINIVSDFKKDKYALSGSKDKTVYAEDLYTREDKNGKVVITFNKQQQYSGRVLGVRSPVQDYNAVPMLKIIGFSTHSGAEANAWLYSMTGGDNDGDTYGFAAIGIKQRDHLKGLDATRAEYYDAGYIDRNQPKKEFKGGMKLDQTSVENAYVGKNTFLVKYNDTQGEEIKTKIRESYERSELDAIAYGKAFLKKFNDVTAQELKDAEKAFTADSGYTMKRAYVNMIIRNMTQGDNTATKDNNKDGIIFTESDYDLKNNTATAKAKIDQIYNKYKETIHKYYIYGIKEKNGSISYANDLTKDILNLYKKTLSKADQAELAKYTEDVILRADTKDATLRSLKEKMMFNVLYDKVLSNTITRIQVSKRGINVFGGNRKKQIVASILSVYPNLNKNISGNVWNPLREKDATLSVESIFKGLMNFSDLGKKFYDTIYKDISLLNAYTTQADFVKETYKYVDADKYNKELTKLGITEQVTKKDIEDLLGLVYNNYRKALLVEKELIELGSIFKDEKLESLRDFLAKSSKKDDVFVKQLIRRIGKDKSWLSNTEIAWIKALYFGRFTGDADAFFRLVKTPSKLEASAKHYGAGYIKQQVLDRRAFKKMSDKATEIIAVAKHFGVDANSSEYLRVYTKLVKELTAGATKRRVAVEDEHHLSMAIAMDMNPFDTIRERDEDLNAKFEELDKGYQKNVPPIRQESHPSKYIDVLKKQLDDNGKAQLLGVTAGVPDVYYDSVKNSVEKFLKILNKDKDLNITVENDEFVKVIDEIMSHGIAMYHIERMLTNAYSLYRRINNYYHDTTGGSTLNHNDYDYIKYGTYFFELSRILFSPSERKALENTYSNYPNVVKFLLNIRQQDPEYLEERKATTGEEVPDEFKEDEDDRTSMETSREYLRERVAGMSERMNTNEVPQKFEEADLYTRKVVNDVLTQLNLIGSKQPNNMYDLLETFVNDMSTFKKIQQTKQEEYETSGNTPTKEQQVKINLINKYVFGVHNIATYLKDVRESSTKLQTILNDVDMKEALQKILQAKQYVLEEALKTINAKKEYFELIEDPNEMIKSFEEIQSRYAERLERFELSILGRAFNEKLATGALLLHTEHNKSLKHINHSKPKYLDPKYIEDLYGSNMMNMDKYQTPFLFLIDLFKDNNGNYDWKGLFKWYKENRRFYRFTVVMKAFKDETLARKFSDVVYKEDEWWNNLSSLEKSKWKNIRKHRKNLKNSRFNTPEELTKYMEELDAGKETKRLVHRGTVFNGVDLKSTDLAEKFNVGAFISPTLKEIDIRSGKDFQEIYEFIKQNGEELLIGFSDLNSVMDATEQAWKPYRMEGMFGDFVLRMQLQMKFFMRASGAFLFRNIIDTWMQLFSHMYVEQGGMGMIKNSKQILRYMGMTMHVDSVYKDVSEESFLMRADVNLDYTRLNKVLTDVREKKVISNEELMFVKSVVHRMQSKLKLYIEGFENLNTKELTKYMTSRHDYAKKIEIELDELVNKVTNMTDLDIKDLVLLKDHRIIKQTLSYIMDTRFAEFFTLYSYLQVDPSKTNGYRERIERVISKYKGVEFDDFKHILFEISAFMQTNAQLDVYRQESYKHLTQMINDEKHKDTENYQATSYEELFERLKNETTEHKERVLNYVVDPMKALVTGHLINTGKEVVNAYNQANSWIESTARIAGYLFDRYLHNKQFDDTVNRSLKRWFNYGQRSPLEMQLLADIPYLSFPIRSIDNWIGRMTNPQYLRVMSDFIDGIYAQYADDDGQYDKYVQFQIQNGWLPIGGGVGLRLGHGGLDIQSILSDAAGFVEQRTSPILRAVKTLVKDKDVIGSLKALAMTGIITRTANTFGPRELLQETPVVNNFVTDKPRSIGSSTAFTFDHYDSTKGYGYKKYTPKQYLNNNGRYPYYESVYKDWFNKYGRMRKPTVDPYSLVKNIQWKSYVRQRQRQNILR